MKFSSPEKRANSLANLRLGSHGGRCKRGHDLSHEDPRLVYVYPDGRRECRLCRRKVRSKWLKENREARNEYYRIRTDALRSSEGRSKRQEVTPRPIPRGQYLPAEPFAEWLREQVEDLETHTTWARDHGISKRLIYSLLRGERESVSLDSVDFALTAAGVPWLLEEMYPLEEAK